MGQPVIINSRSIYPFEQKVSALKALRENNFNYSKTAREHSLVDKTIQRWRGRDGEAVFELLDKYNEDVKKLNVEEVNNLKNSIAQSKAEEDYSDKSYYKLVRETKMIAVKRLFLVLKEESEVRKIVNSLKLLEEISKDFPEDKDQGKTEADKYAELLLKTYYKKK